MVTNWTMGGAKPNSLYHVTPEGEEYASRNINGTMGNLMSSQASKGGRVYNDMPVRKRLTNSEAEFIAHKNQHGSAGAIMYSQNAARVGPGVSRLRSSDALDIQDKALNGSMNEIMTVPQGGGKPEASNKHCVRAMNDDARTNVQKGQVGTIGALVLNPGSVNVCNEHEKYGAQQRRAADAGNAPAVKDRVFGDTAGRIAQQGKNGTYGILNGNTVTPNNTNCKRHHEQVKAGFAGSQAQPAPRVRNEAGDRNMAHGTVGTLGVLLQGKPLDVNSTRNKYVNGVSRSLDAQTVQPQPRVRPEAQEIADHHKGHVKNLLVDVTNKPKPRIMRSNSADRLHNSKIKEAARQGKRKVEKVEEKPLWKNSKYERTESRLKQWMDKQYGERPSTAARPATADRANPGIKKSSSETCLRSNRNFVTENARKAKAAPVRANPVKVYNVEKEKRNQEEKDKYKSGVVPPYLQSRVAQWKAEEKERVANLPDPTVPEGHTVMPRAEKEETLNVLVKSRDQLLTKLRDLPLRNDTLRLHNTRTHLENKIAEIEDAVKIFSRPRVFIKQE